MQRSNLKTTYLLLALLFTFSANLFAEKDGYVELRGGIDTYKALLTNDHSFTFSFVSVDLTLGKKIGYMESMFNFSFFGATSNSLQTIDGTVTNTQLSNRYFLARAFSIEFAEYFPFTFLGDKLKVSPGIDIKFAHYNDLSAEEEFFKPTKDYMYTFLRLALKTEAKFGAIRAGAEYRYPILAALTDKLLKENRYETYFNIYAGYAYSDVYAKFGFDISKLTYSNPLLNSLGQRYISRSQGTLYLSLGVNF